MLGGGGAGFEVGGEGFDIVGEGVVLSCGAGFAALEIGIALGACAGMDFGCDACVGFEILGEASRGVEIFDVVGVLTAVFADKSRTSCSILDVSGVTGVFVDTGGGATFLETGEGFGDATGASIDFEATLGVTAVVDVVFLTAGIFADVETFAFVAFGVAVVDFALVVAVLTSGTLNSCSIGSEIIFFGRPLFLTIVSADMSDLEICETLVRAGRGN